MSTDSKHMLGILKKYFSSVRKCTKKFTEHANRKTDRGLIGLREFTNKWGIKKG